MLGTNKKPPSLESLEAFISSPLCRRLRRRCWGADRHPLDNCLSGVAFCLAHFHKGSINCAARAWSGFHTKVFLAIAIKNRPKVKNQVMLLGLGAISSC